MMINPIDHPRDAFRNENDHIPIKIDGVNPDTDEPHSQGFYFKKDDSFLNASFKLAIKEELKAKRSKRYMSYLRYRIPDNVEFIFEMDFNKNVRKKTTHNLYSVADYSFNNPEQLILSMDNPEIISSLRCGYIEGTIIKNGKIVRTKNELTELSFRVIENEVVIDLTQFSNRYILKMHLFIEMDQPNRIMDFKGYKFLKTDQTILKSTFNPEEGILKKNKA